MTNETKPGVPQGDPTWGTFEFGRRLGLQAAGVLAASGALVGITDVSNAYAASKSQTIKIGYVSPRTGSLADFAGPDSYVLSLIRKSSYFTKGITIGKTKYHIEITEKDTQSLGNVAVQVTQELINSGVVSPRSSRGKRIGADLPAPRSPPKVARGARDLSTTPCSFSEFLSSSEPSFRCGRGSKR
jgi:hypothetical protein